MSAQHTQGKLQAGVSIFQGCEVFTAVPTDNEQKIVALFGLCGSDDEAESVANLRRFVACWSKFHGTSTLTIESMTKPVHEVLFDAGARMNAAESQRDTLLKTLKEVAETFGDDWREGSTQRRLGDRARAAIAKAEGGAT